jgi:hypothetical protein
MSGHEEDDKPTVVLDLNALKKQKLKQEEELANLAQELEFNIPQEASEEISHQAVTESKPTYKIILFDFQSDFFEKSLQLLPQGYNYVLTRTLNELNLLLKNKTFQIVVFNYDVNPKAVNQLSAQIKQKLPTTKTLIMARAISPEKAKIHAQTASGATGYYQLPLEAQKIEKELQRIQSQFKKVS